VLIVKTLLTAVLLTALSAMTPGLADPAEEFVEGIHYERIVPPVPTRSDDAVEVVELFWYGCPHCYSFEPYVERWLESSPPEVDFRRSAPALNPNWAIHAKAFYAAEALGATDRMHAALFDAIHEGRRSLNDVDALAAFFAAHGIEEARFRQVFDSFHVDMQSRQATAQARQYGIGGVPAVIINGKYRTSGSRAGSYADWVRLIDHLVAVERAAAGAQED
jgi:thiol:disulfide interchange protein DsbA